MNYYNHNYHRTLFFWLFKIWKILKWTLDDFYFENFGDVWWLKTIHCWFWSMIYEKIVHIPSHIGYMEELNYGFVLLYLWFFQYFSQFHVVLIYFQFSYTWRAHPFVPILQKVENFIISIDVLLLCRIYRSKCTFWYEYWLAYWRPTFRIILFMITIYYIQVRSTNGRTTWLLVKENGELILLVQYICPILVLSSLPCRFGWNCFQYHARV